MKHSFMKKSILSALLLTLSLTAAAVPAKRVQRTLALSDGTHVTATLGGDETFHYWQTEDGRAFVTDGEGNLTEVSLQQAQETLKAKVRANNARRRARNARRKSAWGAESNPVSGNRKGLVILVNFSDLELRHTQADYEAYFNRPGYSSNGCSGSVRDYFLSQSYGQFVLDFDVVGPVTVSRPYSYYGKNDSGGDDMYAATMVAEAVQLAVPALDLRPYDWDGDGYVDQVYVVYAGYGEHAGASENTIWPHEYELSAASEFLGDGPGALTFGGLTIDTYACSCELRNSTGTTMDGIGTACHEFSHCLCLPDMYDTSGKAFGMDAWDLMDYGSYSGLTGNGETPAPFTSYERMYCGWLDPVELTDPCAVSNMPALEDQPVAYLVRNSSGSFPGEYYLLENRQQKGWDEYSPAHGMLVLHVDFDADAWAANEVNATYAHQRMTIVPADNRLTRATMGGDTWPGTTNNTALTDTSTPSARLYNANADGRKFLGHPITEISEADGMVSFLFDGGFVVGTPTLAVLPESITATGFRVEWTAVDEATDYEVQLTRVDAEGHAVSTLYYLTASTFRVFDSLEAGASYAVSVRARQDGVPGDWSAEVKAELPSAIHRPSAESGRGAVYDLQGRCAEHPRRGIYIRDRHKYVVR